MGCRLRVLYVEPQNDHRNLWKLSTNMSFEGRNRKCAFTHIYIGFSLEGTTWMGLRIIRHTVVSWENLRLLSVPYNTQKKAFRWPFFPFRILSGFLLLPNKWGHPLYRLKKSLCGYSCWLCSHAHGSVLVHFSVFWCLVVLTTFELLADKQAMADRIKQQMVCDSQRSSSTVKSYFSALIFLFSIFQACIQTFVHIHKHTHTLAHTRGTSEE